MLDNPSTGEAKIQQYKCLFLDQCSKPTAGHFDQNTRRFYTDIADMESVVGDGVLVFFLVPQKYRQLLSQLLLIRSLSW